MNLCDSIEHISTNQHGNESPCALSTTKRKGHDEVVPSNKTPATSQQLLDNARPRHFGLHGNALLHAQSLQGPFQDTGIQGIVNARVREASSFDPDSSFKSIDDFDLWERCITRGVPGAMMPHILGNSYEIVQAPGLVAIRYELVHDVRIIPLDGSAHLTKAFELEMGDARGHWDGNALVVESTNYKDRSAYRNANAATLRLVERFTRTSADRIEWSVTVNDPATWTKPWTFSLPLTQTDAEPVLEFACHEGNYALPHILSGARAAEASSRQR